MKDKVKIGVILVLVAIIIFILSYSSIWTIDCITYQYNFANGEKIKSITDIFESQYVHYFTWNGRYVAHWLCQLFLPLLGKGVFSVFNAVVYVVFIILIIKNTVKYTISPKRLLTATLLVLLFCDTFYTPPFQIGYIWMAVLSLSYLYLFFNYADSKSHSAWNCFWLLPFSIIAGNGQEAINIGIGGALIVYALMNIKRMTEKQWCMFVGFGIGGLFLCLSPATIGRTEEMVTAPLYSVINLFLTLRVFYIFFIVLIYDLLRHRITLKDFYLDNSFFLGAIITLFVFNLLIGVGGTRQLFGIELFSCIITIRLLKNHTFSKLFLVLFSMLIIVLYILKYMEIKKAEKAYNEVSEKIEANPFGPLFIDFPQFNPYIHSTASFRYGAYLDYALVSIRTDRTNNIRNENILIPCYPTYTEELLKERDANIYYEYFPGEFILLQSKEKPKAFTLHRSINILGLRIPLPPYKVEFDTDSHLNTEDYNIMYLPELMPIIKNQGITIE